MGKSVKLGQMPNSPAFSAGRSSSQSVTSGAWTKVQCNTEEFDTTSAYDNATNFRFQPTVSGYYQISAGAYASGSSLSQVISAIFKNGAVYKYGQPIAYNGALELSSNASCLVYLNGSTDYVELFAMVAGTSPALVGNVALTFFQAAMVRSA
ncbi:MAG: hypothetical protein ACKO0Z_09665 [Betaproteobacteria bacterium]